MNGLELAKGYYEEYGKPMLENEFSDLLPLIAVGFVGSGSEHYGFDDEISRDHDFEPGFCIFLPGEDVIDRKQQFKLERAYAKLPKEYAGCKRQPISPVGGIRNGGNGHRRIRLSRRRQRYFRSSARRARRENAYPFRLDRREHDHAAFFASVQRIKQFRAAVSLILAKRLRCGFKSNEPQVHARAVP